MKTTKYIVLGICFICVSCHYASTKNESKKAYSKSTDDTFITESRNMVDSVTFLDNCNNFMKGSWQGALQGTNANEDSISYLCFAACYDCKETYEVIFVHKGGVEARKIIGGKKIWEEFQESCNNKFKNFDCFVFVIHVKDPEKQDDIHLTRYSFPSKVKAFKRVDLDKWMYIGTKVINNFQDYGNFRFKIIYGIK
jgi:hypothetical protein